MFSFFFRGKKLSEPDYAQLLIRRIQVLDPGRELSYDAQEHAILLNKNPPHHAFIGNLYKDYLRASQEMRPALLERQAKLHVTPPVMLNDELDYETSVRPHLIPILRSRGEMLMLQNLDPRRVGVVTIDPSAIPRMSSRLLGEDRAVFLAFDTPEAISQVSDAQLEKWGVSFDQAFADAVINLRAGTTPRWEEMEGGFFRAAWNDSYDCSRVVLPEAFLDLPFQGRPVAVVAARNDLFVADEHNPAGQAAMLRQALKNLEANNRWCAGSLIVLGRDGTWMPYASPDPVVSRAETNLRNLVMHREYGTQKEVLDKANQASKIDTFVATFMAFEQKGSDNIVSMCTFSEGVEAVLPKTERIMFLESRADGKPSDAPLAILPWDKAYSIAGSLMTQTQDYPPRFHVKGFPDVAMRQRLRAAEVGIEPS